jgi:DNA polymerase-3 subunit delta'
MNGNWDLIGHFSAIRILDSAVSSGRLSHAYLITGPKQVGRFTLAKQLAMAANCESTNEAPCGNCSQCDRVERGLHADVRMIDRHTPIRGVGGGEASTPEKDASRARLSIEHIRDLQRDGHVSPFEGKRHVFIIEDAETLKFNDGITTPTANALLKTLEEPTETSMLILVAPDCGAVPETVASRCQWIQLRPVPIDQIQDGLVSKYSASPEDAEMYARLSNGRPGRAIELFEDPAAVGHYDQMVQRIIDASTSSLEGRFRYARELSGQFRKDKSAVEAELEVWSSVWRDAMLAKHGVKDGAVHVNWQDQLADLAAACELNQIVDVIEGSRSAISALRANAAPQLVLEVMMLNLPSINSPVGA